MKGTLFSLHQLSDASTTPLYNGIKPLLSPVRHTVHFHETQNAGCLQNISNKSSAVAEIGDHGHNRHGPKREGLLCPFRGGSRVPV